MQTRTVEVKSRHPLIHNLLRFFSNPLSRSVGLVFMSHSMVFGSWVTHIPFVKDELKLDEGVLGLVLFAMPVGLLVMNPLTAIIIRRIGAPRATLLSVICYASFALIPVISPNVYLLGLGLFLMGLSGSLVNVSMNTCTTDVERKTSLMIMSTCHGMWSLGGLLGSTISSILKSLGVSPPLHMLGLGILIIILNILLNPILMQLHTERKTGEGGAVFAFPDKVLGLMILVGLCISMGEGVAFDWSGVYLRDYVKTSDAVSALGFAAFTFLMTLGRFLGDFLIPRWGGRLLLQSGGVLVILGLCMAIFFPMPFPTIVGFALIGAGTALGAPILYSASSNLPGYAAGAGLATYATFSFLGFLAGPPLIGYIAKGFGLPWGFACTAMLTFIAIILSRKLKI